MEIKHIFIALALLIATPTWADDNSDKEKKDKARREKLSDNEMSDKLASKKARPLAPDAVSREFLYSVSPENPYHVGNPTIVTLGNDPSDLPDYGSRHMFLFYVDPESYVKESANRDLEKELKADGKLGYEGKTYSPDIQGYAVLNLADTKLPSGLIRGVVKMVLGKNVPSLNFADNDHSLRNAWKMPDVNNKFVLMFITKDGDMVFYRESPMSPEDKELMYNTIQKYR
ncbi:MAG: hypothetical protein IJ014_00955 [Rikenellaceae bacterium]|nr:hypothetical protein [Rikenellaceae bacterium]